MVLKERIKIMKDLERICEESYCRLFLRFKMFFDLLTSPRNCPLCCCDRGTNHKTYGICVMTLENKFQEKW